jgi:hypothetical protein
MIIRGTSARTLRRKKKMNQDACIFTMLAASYVGGKFLTPAEQSYEEHLMDCEDCLRAVEWLRSIESLGEKSASRVAPSTKNRARHGSHGAAPHGYFAYFPARIDKGRISEKGGRTGEINSTGEEQSSSRVARRWLSSRSFVADHLRAKMTCLLGRGCRTRLTAGGARLVANSTRVSCSPASEPTHRRSVSLPIE